MDDEGEWVDLLANEIGGLDGSTALGIEVAGEYLLDISADGDWTVLIEQPRPTSAPYITEFSGAGMTATDLFSLRKGLNRFTLTHDGEGYFGVVLLDNEGNWIGLLANEIGEYDGSTAEGIDESGIYILDISADGNWIVSIEGPPSTTTTSISTTTTTKSPTTTSTKKSTTTTTTTDDSTTTTTSGGGCTSELIYGEDSEEAEMLRFFRDNVLSQTPEGQEIIKLYYQWSPVIVKAMEEDEEFKEEVKDMIDGVLKLVGGDEK